MTKHLTDKASISFEDDDFFSQIQKEMFLEQFEQVDDKVNFIKESVIHRILIEQQAGFANYKKLIQLIQVYGIHTILNIIEGNDQKEEGMTESEVERIVRQILKEQNFQPANQSSPQPQFNAVSHITEKAKNIKNQVAKPKDQRKKPPSKLKNI